MLDIIKFWMDKGIDGFRVDVIWALIKDELFRDEPPNPEWDGVDPFCSLNHIYTQDLPEVHSIIRNMRSGILSILCFVITLTGEVQVN